MVACLDLLMEPISYLTYHYYRPSSNKFGLYNLVSYLLSYCRCCSLGIHYLHGSLFLPLLNPNFSILFVITLSMVFFIRHSNNLQMSRHVTKSNLLKALSFVCILQVGGVLAKLCWLHGEFFQHDILLQQKHKASPHNSVVQVQLDC